ERPPPGSRRASTQGRRATPRRPPLRAGSADLLEQRAIPGERRLATRLPNDVVASAPAHGLEIVVTAVCRPDRSGQLLRVARRYDDAAADLPHELRGLALVLGRGDHRPARGEHAVDA